MCCETSALWPGIQSGRHRYGPNSSETICCPGDRALLEQQMKGLTPSEIAPPAGIPESAIRGSNFAGPGAPRACASKKCGARGEFPQVFMN